MTDPLVVTIPTEEYLELLEDQRFLECLRNNGVDNWEWYDDAVDAFNDGEG